jgi:peptidoglycan-associated lipoprotein
VAAGRQTTPAEGAVSQKASDGAISEEELDSAGQERRRAAAKGAVAAHLQDIFFDFDSYIIRVDDRSILKQMADWLVANETIKLTIEGYCDERGTIEYNLALGQKRAEAAKDYFVKSGVSASRIRTVSYGKEAPGEAGHTEEAWARNRRDHFASQ